MRSRSLVWTTALMLIGHASLAVAQSERPEAPEAAPPTKQESRTAPPPEVDAMVRRASAALEEIGRLEDRADRVRRASAILAQLRPHLGDLSWPDAAASELWQAAGWAVVHAKNEELAPLAAAMLTRMAQPSGEPEVDADTRAQRLVSLELSARLMVMTGRDAVLWQSESRDVVRQEYADAHAGDVDQMVNLALSYDDGLGVPLDDKAAVRWYRKAANLGNAHAMYCLGIMYDMGEGVEQDYATGAVWYRKASNLGHAAAMFNLGICYKIGEGVEEDAARALEWFRRSADRGDPDAMYELGIAYDFGEGVEQDHAEAVSWYSRAAEFHHQGAMYNLGVAYDRGEGVERDRAEAARWYRRAADRGHADAAFNLGMCYEHGEGVERSIESAIEWYQRAAQLGDEMAEQQLRDLGVDPS